MTLVMREVDVHGEKERLAPFLRDHLPAHRNTHYYDWLYLRNPFGRGRAWVALEEGTTEIVGAAAAFPRLTHVNGQPTTCWNLGDFAILPEYRSLGPAVQLQRCCLREVLDGGIPFAYDHPSCNMMAVYRWMKIMPTGEVVRYARPLRVDGQVEKILGKGALSRGVSGVGNLALSIAGRRASTASPINAAALTGRFDDRVDALDHRLSAQGIVAGARTADYLNWRYLDNPLGDHDVFIVEEDEMIRGYIVVRREDETATVTDFMAEPESSVTDALLSRTIDSVRGTSIRTLSVPVLQNSALVPTLEGWGFQPRESRPFVVSTQHGGPLDGTVNRAANWYHTDGDRDV